MMIGHFARDRVVVDGDGKLVPGGAVYFGSMVLRRLGLRVAVVTRLHADDFHLLEEVRQAGVRVSASSAAETSGIENIYDSADMERCICHPLGFAGSIQLADIPDIMSPQIFAITPIMAGEVDLDLLKALAQRGPVALDVQGFVRVRDGNKLVFKPWSDLVDLSQITYLKVDRAEAELLTGLTDLNTAPEKSCLRNHPGSSYWQMGRSTRPRLRLVPCPGAPAVVIPVLLPTWVNASPPHRKRQRAGPELSPPSSRNNPVLGRARWS